MRSTLKVLLALLLIVAVVYFSVRIFYPQNQNPVTPKASTDVADTGLSVKIPQRVYENSKVTVSVEAGPGANCDLSYITPAGTLSEASGLGQTTAGSDGLCSWSWIVDRISRPGSGRVIIKIEGATETHFFEVRAGE